MLFQVYAYLFVLPQTVSMNMVSQWWIESVSCHKRVVGLGLEESVIYMEKSLRS